MLSGEHYQVTVNLHFTDKNTKTKLVSDITLVAGDTKKSEPILRSGESQKTHLWPKINSSPTIYIAYYFNNQGIRKKWAGPEMPRNIPYEIDIYIDENGDVTDYKITE